MSDYTETTGTVARLLGRSPSRVLQIHEAGKLDAIRDSSGRRLFSARSVARYLASRKAAEVRTAA